MSSRIRLTISLSLAECRPDVQSGNDRRFDDTRQLAFFFQTSIFHSSGIVASSNQPISPPLRAEKYRQIFLWLMQQNHRLYSAHKYRFRFIFSFGLDDAVAGTLGWVN